MGELKQHVGVSRRADEIAKDENAFMAQALQMAGKRLANCITTVAIEGVDVVQRRGAQDAVERIVGENRLCRVADEEREIWELEFFAGNPHRLRIDVDPDNMELRVEQR